MSAEELMRLRTRLYELERDKAALTERIGAFEQRLDELMQMLQRMSESAMGSTVRDIFASQAVGGLIAGGMMTSAADGAERAYLIADAMMAERDKSTQKG